MKVLYINYVDMERPTSGSSHRPKKMYEAMLESGYEVDMISGLHTKEHIRERKAKIRQFLSIMTEKTYDFCYIELPSGFINCYINPFEYKLIRQIKKIGIPIGVFYRDIYWKFYKGFGKGGLKYELISHMQKRDLKFLDRNVDVFFVPSERMARYMSVSKPTYPLPPGCMITQAPAPLTTGQVIYVGSASYAYGTDLLLEAMKIVNKSRPLRLNLICRENERGIVDEFIAKEGGLPSWLNVAHVFGRDLADYYAQSDFAIYASRKSEYFDFALPIKIFEYISYQKPIVTTDCEEIRKVIEDNGLGICVRDNAQALADGILDMSVSGIKQYSYALREYRDCNTWCDRVKKIAEILLNIRQTNSSKCSEENL